MTTFAIIVNEVFLVLYYVVLVTGILVWIGTPTLLLLSFWWGRQLEFGTNDQLPEPLTSELPELRSSHELNREYPAAIDMLADCQVHQRMLKFFYNELCERAGCDPNAMSPMTDLIAEAVFDGRRRKECINEFEKLSKQKKGHEHAEC